MFLGCVDDWSYVSAELEAGKRYFIIANLSMGRTNVSQVFRAIHKDDEEFGKSDIEQWLMEFDPMELDPVEGEAPAAASKKKRKRPLRGGLSSHFDWQGQAFKD